jgi:hypothetical protein
VSFEKTGMDHQYNEVVSGRQLINSNDNMTFKIKTIQLKTLHRSEESTSSGKVFLM